MVKIQEQVLACSYVPGYVPVSPRLLSVETGIEFVSCYGVKIVWTLVIWIGS